MLISNRNIFEDNSSKKYSVDLNNGSWRTPTNFDSTQNIFSDYYIYESNESMYDNGNYGTTDTKMFITVKGYSSFTIWINSYAESRYDYTIALEPDVLADVSYDDGREGEYASYVRSSTYDFQDDPSTGISESNWVKVIYEFSDTSSHTIQISFVKDSSAYIDWNCGYVAIPKNQ